MNMYKKMILLLVVALLTNPIMAKAEEDEISSAETQIAEETTKPDYVSRVKEKYSLTDEQIQKMKDSKISEPQFAVVGALAKESGKTVEDILKMRTEDQKGWGKIAKELGVAPKMIGQSIAAMHRQNDMEKQTEKKEKREARKAERKEHRAEKRTARKEARGQRQDRRNQ